MRGPIYNITEALKSMTRNRAMSIASIASIACSLFILGLILSIVLNINNITDQAKDQFNTIQAFVENTATYDDVEKVKEQISKIDHVKSVTIETKSEAMEKLKERWGSSAYLLEGLPNPLQDSVVVEVEDLAYSDQVFESMKKVENIDDIVYHDEVMKKLQDISNFISTSGLILMGVLMVIALFIISTTIKLTLYARRKEIFIMKYIGATNWFIRWPFIIEGMLLGVIGAAVATLIIFVLYGYVEGSGVRASLSMFNYKLLGIDTILKKIIVIFASTGICIGTVGSLFSLRRYLKV
ncbi:MAG: permease-like cell division protein FtsX [Filifactoraceae bacterium]